MGELIALILLGVCVGVLIGGLGGGGGVVAVPLFMWVIGVSAVDAGTFSLIAVAGAAVIAVAMGAVAREIQWRWAALFGVIGIIGSALGSVVAMWVDDVLLLMAFGLVVVFAAVRFVLGIVRGLLRRVDRAPSAPLATLAAGGIGAVTGLVGVGGGFLIAPALMSVVQLAPRAAIATSSAVILFNSLSSLASRVVLGFDMDLLVVVPVLLGAVVGALGGKLLATLASANVLQYASGGLLGICALAVAASLLQTVWA